MSILTRSCSRAATSRAGTKRPGRRGWRACSGPIRATPGSTEDRWDYVPSIGVARQLLEGRTYPLTLARIDRVTRALNAR